MVEKPASDFRPQPPWHKPPGPGQPLPLSLGVYILPVVQVPQGNLPDPPGQIWRAGFGAQGLGPQLSMLTTDLLDLPSAKGQHSAPGVHDTVQSAAQQPQPANLTRHAWGQHVAQKLPPLNPFGKLPHPPCQSCLLPAAMARHRPF